MTNPDSHTTPKDAERCPSTPDEAHVVFSEDEDDLMPTAQSSIDSAQAAKPTILVVHASVGSGHRSAAYATAEAFEILRDSANEEPLAFLIPENLDIEVLDILDFGRIKFDGDKTASMFTGPTRPIYDLTWRLTFTGRLLWGGGTIWSRLMFPKFTELVREKKPLAIVCTHITAANVAVGARMLSGQRYPVICIPTDYEIEGLWPHRETDLFCVANESMAETLRPRKVEDSDIAITGIPTRDSFRQEHDKQAVRNKFDLPHDKMIVLVLAGAYLPRPYVHFRETVDTLIPYFHTLNNMHFVFVAGNDGDYAQHLRTKCNDLEVTNMTVLGYVDNMAALMAASDLTLCKSGGLVVTECLCAEVPMILIGRAYGQEKANVRMLTSMGASMHTTTSRELLEALRHISQHPESIRAMLINGEIIRYPNAALDIARATFRLITEAKEGKLTEKRKRFARFYWGKKPAHIR